MWPNNKNNNDNKNNNNQRHICSFACNGQGTCIILDIIGKKKKKKTLEEVQVNVLLGSDCNYWIIG